LSSLEREILVWLAIEREGVSLHDLTQNLVRPPAAGDLLEGLRGLQRRSLLERTDAGFALQNVVTEYVTDHLVNQICREIGGDEILSLSDNLITLSWLNCFALTKAEAKEYLRQSQI